MSQSDDKDKTVFGASSTMFGSSGSGGLFGSSAGSSGLFGNSTGSTGLFGNSTSFSFGGGDAAFGASPAKAKAGGDEDDDGEGEGSDNDADESHAAEFKPVIQLSMVEVKNCEEDEDVVFKRHSKLFVFIKEDNYGGEKRQNYWKERGLGEVKILKSRLDGYARLLMRQEKTLKIAANHRIDPECDLKRTAEKSFTFSAVDFADDEGKKEVFSLKFANVEDADQFQQAFDLAKKDNALAKSKGFVAPVVPVASVPVAAPVASVAAPVAPVAAPVASAPVTAPVVVPAAPTTSALVVAAPVSVGAYSKKEDVFDDQIRALGKFAAGQINLGTLVRIASCKSQVVAGKNYRMALHILYANNEQVHAHVVTVFQPLPHEAASGPVLVEQVYTGRVF
ncbi:hypothetical protein BASA81_003560 [Batrachochytrium salamandrivorans]|nr:hypothetical protein BASA81_003560 [Batrachochytrium salamandrivorans]